MEDGGFERETLGWPQGSFGTARMRRKRLARLKIDKRERTAEAQRPQRKRGRESAGPGNWNWQAKDVRIGCCP
jgi:hypothetical protein